VQLQEMDLACLIKVALGYEKRERMKEQLYPLELTLRHELQNQPQVYKFDRQDDCQLPKLQQGHS